MAVTANMVVDRLTSFEQVQSAKTRYLEPIKDRLDAHIGPGLGVHAWGLVDGVSAQLGHAAVAMREAAEALETERIESRQAGTIADQATAGVREVLIPLRRMYEGAFGPEYVRELGFDGPTPDDPTAVHVMATYVRKRVEIVKPPKSTFGDSGFDPVAHAANLDAPLARLTDVLGHASEESRESDVALRRKNAAVADFDQKFSLAANLISMFLDAAGQRDLARKVRPSRSRPGNTIDVAGGEPEPVLPAPPAADPAAPAADPAPTPAGE